MRIIARGSLVRFWEKHPEARPSLERWLRLTEAATWDSMDDVRQAIASVNILNAERARFEVAGGNFRMIVAIAFRYRIVFVKFLGTHREYDDVDPFNVSDF